MAEPVKIFLRGAPGLAGTIVPPTPATGFADIVAEAHPQAPPLELTFEECDGVAAFRDALSDGSSAAFGFQPQIVVMSVEADLRHSVGEWGATEARRFESDLSEVVHLIKEKLGSHIIVLNGSSVDPSGKVASYHGLDREPLELRTHRYNLAVMHVSFQEGISIIDVDRLVAELGAERVVRGFLEYEPQAALAICHELARVVEDYGFFDSRPLVPQVGRDAAS